MGKLNSFISALVSISMLMNPLAFAADSSPGSSSAEAPGPNVDVMDYAFDVERASRFFDKYGSIVPKQPDVWGESRLARYRQEFETEMAKDIDDFKTTMQAALGRSDQAYLTMALSLNAAAGGEAGGGPLQNLTGKLGNATTAIENMQKLVEAYKKLQELLNLRKQVQQQAAQKAKDAASDGQDNGAGNGGDDDGDGGDDNNAGGGADNDGGGDAGDGNGGDSDGDTTANGDDTGEDQPAPAGEEDDVASLVTAMDKLVQRTKFGDLIQGAQIGLDPSLYLDQKATYLRHLEEIRRINEGDDTADSAGYGLYLLRIPVSVNPGNQTKTGYGAEATFVVSRPPLTASQINKIMEDLVLSDVTEMLANPISKMLKTWWKIKEAASGTDSDVSQSAKEFALLAPAAPFGAFQQSYMSPGLPEIDILEGFSERLMETYKETDTEDKKAGKLKAEAGEAFKAIAETVGSHAPLDSFAARRSLFPLPPSQAQDVLGTWQLRTITESVAEKVGSEAEPAQIQAILRAEFEAACDHLQSLRLFEPQDQRVDELKHLDSPAQIAEKILAGRLDEVKLQRAEFIRALDKVTGIKSEYLNDLGQEKLHTYVPEAERTEPAPAKMAATKASAWFVYVCTGLFNHAMTVDIKSVVGSETFPAGTPNYYDGTMTKVELSVFNRYVDERWPLHVFALEPASEDQNVDDRFSERREMQLALAASFMMGNISARTMLNFARRFEMDMKTIALNRTVVAFAHGEKTFGWKFYPRVQTPQPGSNIEQLYRTMWGGPRTPEAAIKQTKIEPGQRECVALVIAPSFVPTLEVHSSTAWFPLGKRPGFQKIVKADFLRQRKPKPMAVARQSHRVSVVENTAPAPASYPYIREEDALVLSQEHERLAAMMPWQKFRIDLPFENGTGGFELFSAGTVGLGPELHGIYGAPGISKSKKTVLFLVGDNFSVHDTKVIAGGVQATSLELLSRNIMKVEIPEGAQGWKESNERPAVEQNQKPVKDPTAKQKQNAEVPAEATEKQEVRIYIATPYGVTQPLTIPLID